MLIFCQRSLYDSAIAWGWGQALWVSISRDHLQKGGWQVERSQLGKQPPLTSNGEHSLEIYLALSLSLCKANTLSGHLAWDILKMNSREGKLLAQN